MSARRTKRRAPKRAAAKHSKRVKKKQKSTRGARTKKSSAPRRTSKKPAAKSKPKSATTSVSTKPALRARLRATRANLSPTERKLASDRVAANLIATQWFRASRRVACYLPNDGEIDTSGIIDRLWRMQREVFLPVLSRLRNDRLWFAPAAPGMELVPNRFRIPEPKVTARELVRAQEIDLILLPLVAFDRQGNRLGRGAGFYDRSLAFLRHRRFLRVPRLVGLAYEFQHVPGIAVDSWDVPLDGVVTDRSVHYTRS